MINIQHRAVAVQNINSPEFIKVISGIEKMMKQKFAGNTIKEQITSSWIDWIFDSNYTPVQGVPLDAKRQSEAHSNLINKIHEIMIKMPTLNIVEELSEAFKILSSLGVLSTANSHLFFDAGLVIYPFGRILDNIINLSNQNDVNDLLMKKIDVILSNTKLQIENINEEVFNDELNRWMGSVGFKDWKTNPILKRAIDAQINSSDIADAINAISTKALDDTSTYNASIPRFKKADEYQNNLLIAYNKQFQLSSSIIRSSFENAIKSYILKNVFPTFQHAPIISKKNAEILEKDPSNIEALNSLIVGYKSWLVGIPGDSDRPSRIESKELLTFHVNYNHINDTLDLSINVNGNLNLIVSDVPVREILPPVRMAVNELLKQEPIISRQEISEEDLINFLSNTSLLSGRTINNRQELFDAANDGGYFDIDMSDFESIFYGNNPSKKYDFQLVIQQIHQLTPSAILSIQPQLSIRFVDGKMKIFYKFEIVDDSSSGEDHSSEYELSNKTTNINREIERIVEEISNTYFYPSKLLWDDEIKTILLNHWKNVLLSDTSFPQDIGLDPGSRKDYSFEVISQREISRDNRTYIELTIKVKDNSVLVGGGKHEEKNVTLRFEVKKTEILKSEFMGMVDQFDPKKGSIFDKPGDFNQTWKPADGLDNDLINAGSNLGRSISWQINLFNASHNCQITYDNLRFKDGRWQIDFILTRGFHDWSSSSPAVSSKVFVYTKSFEYAPATEQDKKDALQKVRDIQNSTLDRLKRIPSVTEEDIQQITMGITAIVSGFERYLNSGIDITKNQLELQTNIVIAEIESFLHGKVNTDSMDNLLKKYEKIFGEGAIPPDIYEKIIKYPEIFEKLLRANPTKEDVLKLANNKMLLEMLDKMSSDAMKAAIDGLSIVKDNYKYVYFGTGVGAGAMGVAGAATIAHSMIANKKLVKIQNKKIKLRGRKFAFMVSAIGTLAMIGTSVATLFWFFIEKGGF